ncbi:MAG: hypothetical protein WCB85_08975 [Candidatus Dormiibacterota bacterium]
MRDRMIATSLKISCVFPGVAGFFGASSIERLPTERGIKGQVEGFKRLGLAQLAGVGV